MVSHPRLEGVPLLVVCNKQDVEVPLLPMTLSPYCLQDAMTIADVKSVFNQSAYKLGVRDCKVHSISAMNGCVHLFAVFGRADVRLRDNVRACVEWMVKAVLRNPSRPPITA